MIRLWDDRAFAAEHRRKALKEARRWDAETLGPQYVRFFADPRPGAKPATAAPAARPRAVAWEDAGSDVKRYRSYNYHLGG